VHLLPVAEALRQVAPREAGAVAEEHRLDEQPVVLGRDPDMAISAGQQVLDPLPLIIAQGMAAHGSVPSAAKPPQNRRPGRLIPIEGTP